MSATAKKTKSRYTTNEDNRHGLSLNLSSMTQGSGSIARLSIPAFRAGDPGPNPGRSTITKLQLKPILLSCIALGISNEKIMNIGETTRALAHIRYMQKPLRSGSVLFRLSLRPIIADNLTNHLFTS